MALKYKVGDRVRIKSLNWYNENVTEYDEVPCGSTDFIPDMTNYCDKIVTISKVLQGLKVYRIQEDNETFNWTDEMIEGLVEEEMPLDKAGQITDFEYEGLAYTLPDGYQFVDENGNIINATKIVLEKKKKDVNLTQEQINAMVHDSCVLFCKHCGCGIPRDTCTSLGTCKEHDEYRTAIRTHLMNKKKKEYPKTYKECCKVMNYCCNPVATKTIHKEELIRKFQFLLLYRDSYWKIAGEEMGLGKPWEPDWKNRDEKKWVISRYRGELDFGFNIEPFRIFAFPTEEMRDAFYENFKKEIEMCKELL